MSARLRVLRHVPKAPGAEYCPWGGIRVEPAVNRLDEHCSATFPVRFVTKLDAETLIALDKTRGKIIYIQPSHFAAKHVVAPQGIRPGPTPTCG
jgi:hypothetical protein